jgi:signal transduction histidine kinase
MVSVARRDGAAPTVVIRVADTGIGIPACHLPHVSDKFYRVQDRAAADVPGSGLSLAIAKSIVDGHDGRILVESVEGPAACSPWSFPGRRPRQPSIDLIARDP